jgi:predicted metal-dependent phosphoesterase TrpH
MRCDLHVHTRASGWVNQPVLRHLGRESYSTPEQVYDVARRRGMDLVTLTDHDTIDGVLDLAGRPDTFLSEEVTCVLPPGRVVHLGVLDLRPSDHDAIQARRRDAEALFAYLAERALPVVLNHPFAALTGARDAGDLDRVLPGATHLEAPNGMMPQTVNAAGQRLAERAGLPTIGGSDAHAIHSVARAWTEVPGARTREEFLAGLRRGCTLARGRSGSYATLTRDVATVFAGGWRENGADALRGELGALVRLAGLALLSPILPLLPVITLWKHVGERRFAARLEKAHAHAVGAPVNGRQAA